MSKRLISRLKISLIVIIFWLLIMIGSIIKFDHILIPMILLFINLWGLSLQWRDSDHDTTYRLLNCDGITYCNICLKETKRGDIEYLDCECGGGIISSDIQSWILLKRSKKLENIGI